MNSLLNLSVSQLKQAADIKERIDSLNSELSKILDGEIPVPFVTGGAAPAGKRGGRRHMSAAGRAKIAAAARARWAKIRAAKGGSSTPTSAAPASAKKRRTMSPAARAKIAAAARARWARVRAGK